MNNLINSIVENNCFWNGEFHNLQPIKEKLLRLSTKWTENYASDILIFFEYFNKYLIEDEAQEIDIYFCQSEIRWIIANDKNRKIKLDIPNYYRGIAKLLFIDNSMSLV